MRSKGTEGNMSVRLCTVCGKEYACCTVPQKMLFTALKMKEINSVLEKCDAPWHTDIAILDAKINIEVDGSHHSWLWRQMESDKLKETFFKEKGFETIRFTNLQVKRELDYCVDEVEKIYKRRINEIFHGQLTKDQLEEQKEKNHAETLKLKKILEEAR